MVESFDVETSNPIIIQKFSAKLELYTPVSAHRMRPVLLGLGDAPAVVDAGRMVAYC